MICWTRSALGSLRSRPVAFAGAAAAVAAGTVPFAAGAGLAAAVVACGGADTTGARCRIKIGPEEEPDEAELADEFEEPAEVPLELGICAVSGDEGTPRVGPEELAGLMPSAPMMGAGAGWLEVVDVELPELPGGVAADGDWLADCDSPWRISVGRPPPELPSDAGGELLVLAEVAAVEGTVADGADCEDPFPEALSSA
jgi:hypothetical protein